MNRDRHEIVFEILKKAKAGRKKTEIMREVNLSYKQAKQYLNVLLDKKLMEMDASNSYKTTKKGLDFLDKCEKCLMFKWEKQNDSVSH